MTSPFPAIEELLPHRASMLLIDKVIDRDSNSVRCLATPCADAWYADNAGAMPAWIGIELMAQTIAVQVALNKRAQGLPMRPGALLGSRNYTATHPSFAAGQPLTIEASMEFSDDSGLGAYQCHITAASETLASATLKVFEPDNFSQFLASGGSPT